MKVRETIDLKVFSPHLFWDVDKSAIDIHKNKSWFIGRVLEYGLLSDLKLIKKIYGIKEIATIASKLRDLSPKTISLLSLLSGIPKEDFRCYTTTQPQKSFWNS